MALEQPAADVGAAHAERAALVVDVSLPRGGRRLIRLQLRLQPQQYRVAKLRIDAPVHSALHVEPARKEHVLVAEIGAEFVRRWARRWGQRHIVAQSEFVGRRLVELEARAVEHVERHDALGLLLQLLRPPGVREPLAAAEHCRHCCEASTRLYS